MFTRLFIVSRKNYETVTRTEEAGQNMQQGTITEKNTIDNLRNVQDKNHQAVSSTQRLLMTSHTMVTTGHSHTSYTEPRQHKCYGTFGARYMERRNEGFHKHMTYHSKDTNERSTQ